MAILRVWSCPLPNKELGAALLVRGIGLTAAGRLTSKSLDIASNLSLPHAVTPTVEDEESPETPETYLTLDGSYYFDVTVRPSMIGGGYAYMFPNSAHW